MMVISDLLSSICLKTASFDTCSVQLIFSILLDIHISKASSLLISPFANVHVSAPYSATLQIRLLIILFLSCLFIFLDSRHFLLLTASLAIPILMRTSFLHLPSSVMVLPRYLNWLTCSKYCPFTFISNFLASRSEEHTSELQSPYVISYAI